MADDVRIRIEEGENGEYKAYLQMFVGDWFDKPNMSCGRGMTIASAVVDLQTEIRNSIAFLQRLYDESHECLIVDGFTKEELNWHGMFNTGCNVECDYNSVNSELYELKGE